LEQLNFSKDHFVLAEKCYTSIQGEGRFVGIPMTYVRMQGCNVGCVWCDSLYTWKPYLQSDKVKQIPTNQLQVRFKELSAMISKEFCRHVWFTGGEPMLQANAILNYMENVAHSNKIYHICTAGTIYNEKLFEILDYVTIDVKAPFSKTRSSLDVIEKTYELIGNNLELKMVVAPTVEDKQYAVEIARRFPRVSLTFQPLYVSELEIRDSLEPIKVSDSYWSLKGFAEWVNDTFRDFERVRMGTQLHKLIWSDKQRLI